MTLADELHHALAVDAEPDLPAIRARVQRRQRRLHWAQGAAVAGLLAVVVGALVAIPAPGPWRSTTQASRRWRRSHRRTKRWASRRS